MSRARGGVPGRDRRTDRRDPGQTAARAADAPVPVRRRERGQEFLGKIIAATNRDLVAEMQARRFREDFYYRLCADQITTPSLREQLDDRPEDLPVMVEFVCRAVVGEEKAAGFAREVVGWIEQHLRGYAWPGNFRELEQCVRSYTIRKQYHPVQPARPQADNGPPQPPRDSVAEACETLAKAVLNKRDGLRRDRATPVHPGPRRYAHRQGGRHAAGVRLSDLASPREDDRPSLSG